MYKVSSSLLFRVLDIYRDAGDEEYRRYRGLLDFLLGDESVSERDKIAASYEDEKKKLDELKETEHILQKKKERGHERGEGGIGSAFSSFFRDMMEEYLPGGYFTWNEYARKMSDDFYRMVYAMLNKLLPRLLSKKLREKKVSLPERSIGIDSEVMNKVITDLVLYFKDHPEEIKTALSRAYNSKDRGGKVAEGFFVPRIDEGTYNEMLSKSDGEITERVGDTDRRVLDNLKDRDEVTWEWKGIDENGILHFTFPELYGSRQFTIKLPSDIQYIKPGTYTFGIKGVNPKRGAIVQFKDQGGIKRERALEEVEESGLGSDELRYFINNGLINRYLTYLGSQPVGKLIEEYIGGFNIGDHLIHSVEDLADLKKYGDIEDLASKTRGEEKVKEKYEESRGSRKEKVDRMMERWTPVLSRYFLRIPERDGEEIAKSVSSKFPLIVEKAKPGIKSIIQTQPVIEMILRYIMSPDMPIAGGGKADPWMHFVVDAFNKMAVSHPIVRKNFEKIVRQERKDEKPSAPVSEEEIQGVLSRAGNLRQLFVNTKKIIRDMVEDSRNDPALKTFFDRRRQFEGYIKNTLRRETEGFIEVEHLDPEKTEDKSKIDRFMKDLINKTVKQMTRQSSDEMDIQMIKLLMPRFSLV